MENVRLGVPRDIQVLDARSITATGEVEEYWTAHTVRDAAFRTAAESSAYLEWRFAEYPLFREFMELWGDHRGDVVLDYGCGPGNDATGFLTCTEAAQVIALDVSPSALALCRQRLMLHRVDPGRVRLLLISDGDPRLPLGSETVDHVNCGGVLHHVSFPQELLCEFSRVLRPGGTANVMVYGHDSVYVHLFVGYLLQVQGGRFEGESLDEAFEHYADGEGCPIARAYAVEDFTTMCERAGFRVRYMGGYLSTSELQWVREDRDAAIRCRRLSDASRRFLTELTIAADGMPLHRGRHAGLSGVYRLTKP
jgi:ubiquinone/menaquinone biosynthesis C-methylase UbiE